MKKHAPNHHTRSHATSPSKQRNSLPERHLAGCQKTLPHIPSAQRSSLLNKTWHETKPFPTKGTTLLTGGNNYINTYDVHAKNTNPYCNFPVTGPTNKQRSHAHVYCILFGSSTDVKRFCRLARFGTWFGHMGLGHFGTWFEKERSAANTGGSNIVSLSQSHTIIDPSSHPPRGGSNTFAHFGA